jgi:hypothetical protein
MCAFEKAFQQVPVKTLHKKSNPQELWVLTDEIKINNSLTRALVAFYPHGGRHGNAYVEAE